MNGQRTTMSREPDAAIELSRAIVQLVFVGFVIAMLLDVTLPLPVLSLCILLLLWLCLRTNATPMLITLQLTLFYRESTQIGRPNASSEFSVAIALGLLAFLSQNHSLSRLFSATIPELFRSLFKKSDPAWKPVTTELDQHDAGSAAPTNFLRQLLLIVGCVLVSRLILLTTVGVQTGVRDNQLSAERLLRPASLLLIVVISVVIVFSEVAWRRLTAAQASMYLRSTQVLLMYADLRMIALKSLKSLRRRKNKRPPISAREIKPVSES